jgi:hypothetical protein
MHGRITRIAQQISQASRAILRRAGCRKWQNGGEESGFARYLRCYARYFAVSSLGGVAAGSPASAQGCQSMATKPGVCSTRRSQRRMAGKVARS